MHKDSSLVGRLSVPVANTYEESLKEGTVIVGTPKTVRAEIERQTEALGINYLIAYMFYGSMKLDDALRSLELFRSEVMPAIADL
jgi:alkanesulfonate monooxygenase SsuD/methylene tetrahydromethanopterin reductase-like flavin-dependent oxidoreductase (luciferase family)